MRFAVFLLVCFASLPAQTSAPVPPPPAVPKLPPDTVIAVVDGKKLTYAELEGFLHALPPQMQQSAMTDRKEFIKRYAFMRKLTAMAEKAQLDRQSPYKESLDVDRLNILTQAQINEMYRNLMVEPAEIEKFYDSNKDSYSQVKVKAIYIGFTSTPAARNSASGKKYLDEAEAKAKAERLVKEARGGADFSKLARENSEDAKSAGENGDFGTLKKSDSLPDAIRSAVFALKQGEISEPVRQANGFWIFKADEVVTRGFPEVKGDIYNQLKETHLKEWIDSINKSLDIKYENEAFFAGPTSPPAANHPGAASQK